jgi:putative intracellular protease/amidase
LLHPYERFTAHGYDVDVLSETGSATVDESSVGGMASGGDKKKWEDKAFPLHAKLAAIKRPDQVQVMDYVAIYFAGGHAACADFPTAAGLHKLAMSIYEQGGGVIGVACHGPAILQGLKLSSGEPLVKGKRATGFSTAAEKTMGAMGWMEEHGFKTMEQVVRDNGGEWHEHASNPMAEYIETDARLVTGMNPASAGAVADAMLKMLPQGQVETAKA